MAGLLYTDVCAGIRAKLDDLITPGGATYTDQYLQIYVEAANRTLVGYLISNGVHRLLFRTDPPLTIPAGTSIIDFSVASGGTAGTGIANLLPDEYTIADRLQEAKIGGLNEDFVPMNGPDDLPNFPSTDSLRYWDDFDGRLHVLPATQDRLVRLDYWGDLGAVNPAGRLSVAWGPALVCLAASSAAASKGQYGRADRLATFDGDVIKGEAGFECNNLINASIKEGQSQPNRRQSYFGLNRYPRQNLGLQRRQ